MMAMPVVMMAPPAGLFTYTNPLMTRRATVKQVSHRPLRELPGHFAEFVDARDDAGRVHGWTTRCPRSGKVVHDALVHGLPQVGDVRGEQFQVNRLSRDVKSRHHHPEPKDQVQDALYLSWALVNLEYCTGRMIPSQGNPTMTTRANNAIHATFRLTNGAYRLFAFFPTSSWFIRASKKIGNTTFSAYHEKKISLGSQRESSRRFEPTRFRKTLRPERNHFFLLRDIFNHLEKQFLCPLCWPVVLEVFYFV